MAGSTPVPLEVALDSLEQALDLLRQSAAFADAIDVGSADAERWWLAVAVIADLVSNVQNGVTEVWRAASGTIFLRSAAIELVDLPDGQALVTSHVLRDPPASAD